MEHIKNPIPEETIDALYSDLQKLFSGAHTCPKCNTLFHPTPNPFREYTCPNCNHKGDYSETTTLPKQALKAILSKHLAREICSNLILHNPCE